MSDPDERFHAALGTVFYLSEPSACAKCGSPTRYMLGIVLASTELGDEEDEVRMIDVCIDDMEDFFLHAIEMLEEPR